MGGSIYNQGNLTLTGVIITNSSAASDGGAIYGALGSTTTIQWVQKSVDWTLETTRNTGVRSTTTMARSPSTTALSPATALPTMAAESITTPALSMLITCSVIESNHAGDYGGGIYNIASGVVRISNSTLSDNHADADGGGIYNYYSTQTLINTTISGNSANGNGGGIARGIRPTPPTCSTSPSRITSPTPMPMAWGTAAVSSPAASSTSRTASWRVTRISRPERSPFIPTAAWRRVLHFDQYQQSDRHQRGLHNLVRQRRLRQPGRHAVQPARPGARTVGCRSKRRADARAAGRQPGHRCGRPDRLQGRPRRAVAGRPARHQPAAAHLLRHRRVRGYPAGDRQPVVSARRIQPQRYSWSARSSRPIADGTILCLCHHGRQRHRQRRFCHRLGRYPDGCQQQPNQSCRQPQLFDLDVVVTDNDGFTDSAIMTVTVTGSPLLVRNTNDSGARLAAQCHPICQR